MFPTQMLPGCLSKSNDADYTESVNHECHMYVCQYIGSLVFDGHVFFFAFLSRSWVKCRLMSSDVS